MCRYVTKPTEGAGWLRLLCISGRWRKLFSLVLIPVLCASCLRAPVKPFEWPQNFPPIDYYQNIYDRDSDNQDLQSREEYLKWVKRFYRGWDLYQDGWQSTTNDILLGVEDPAERRRMELKLFHLGKLMSAEWAKQSPQRNIQTRELSIWGQALLKALNQDKEEKLVDMVTQDVKALLDRKLDRTDINLKRYMQSLSVDL